MKKTIIKSFLLIILLILIIKLVFDPLFEGERSLRFKNTMTELNNINSDSIDILFFGSSHAFTTYNPKILDSAFETLSYNLGSAGQRLIVSSYLQEEVLKTHRPKLVVLDLFGGVMELPDQDKPKSLQLRVFDNTSFSFKKMIMLKNIYNLGEYPSVLSTMIRNKGNWNDLFIKNNENKHRVNTQSTNGYQSTIKVISEKEKKKYKDFRSRNYELKTFNSKNLTIKGKEKEAIIKFVSNARSKNIEVLFVTAPFISSMYSTKFLNFESSVKFLADSLGVNYLNFNKKFNELDLTFADFRDASHLNYKGSNKVMVDLVEYLDKNYDFTITNTSNLLNIKEEITTYIQNDTIETARDKIDENINENFKKTDHFFNDNLHVNKVLFSHDDDNFYITLGFTTDINAKTFDNLSFGVHRLFYKKDFDKRPKWLKNKNGDRLTNNLEPIILQKDKNQILLQFENKKNVKVMRFKAIRIFLRNNVKFNGVIGNALRVNDVEF